MYIDLFSSIPLKPFCWKFLITEELCIIAFNFRQIYGNQNELSSEHFSETYWNSAKKIMNMDSSNKWFFNFLEMNIGIVIIFLQKIFSSWQPCIWGAVTKFLKFPTASTLAWNVRTFSYRRQVRNALTLAAYINKDFASSWILHSFGIFSLRLFKNKRSWQQVVIISRWVNFILVDISHRNCWGLKKKIISFVGTAKFQDDW